MLVQYKYIMDDLFDFLIDGIHEGQPVDGFSNGFDSTALNNIKYQFIRKYEHVNNITDSTIIPVLVITQPDQQFKGKVFYKGKFNDLRSILIKEEDILGQPIKKINFYIVPRLNILNGHSFGHFIFDLLIDYVADYDSFGFMSKEISSILNRHYYGKECGQFHSIETLDNGKLWFVPTQQRVLNQESVLNRIAQTFQIKWCRLV